MKVSTKGRYALRIMIDLAEHNTGGYIRLKDISKRQGITLKYMEQIMPILTKSGYVKSFRGNNGGYMLAKKPEEYTLEISLSGFFSVESENELTDALKNSLVVKNSVAIMMPYLRSQVSLVTAQPEVECVVLPAFNINKMLDNE